MAQNVLCRIVLMGQFNLIHIEAIDEVHIIETECILTGTKMSCSSYWIHISSYLIGTKYKTHFIYKHFSKMSNVPHYESKQCFRLNGFPEVYVLPLKFWAFN